MAAAPTTPKPLNALEQKVLAAIIEKVKPRLMQALEDAKAKLREALGPDALAAIDNAARYIEKVIAEGPPPLPAKLAELLMQAIAFVEFLGLRKPTTTAPAGG